MPTVARFLGVALGVLVIAGPAGAQDRQSLTIATEGAYEPWNFTVDGDKLEGFDVDLANDLCRRMDVQCDIIAQDWDGLIPALNSGKFDAIMASMFITPAREEAIAFSRPYAMGAITFMVDKNGPLAGLPGSDQVLNLNKPDEARKLIEEMRPLMSGRTFGVQSQTSNAFFFEKYYSNEVTINEYKATEQHDLDLQAGRIDGVMAQVTSIKATLKKPGYENYEIAGPTVIGEMVGKGIGVGLRKQDTELKARFDKAIEEAIADGTVTKLSQKWFGFDMVKLL